MAEAPDVIDDGPAWKDFALWCGAGLVTVLQLVGLWQVKRIGELETGKADKSELEKLVAEMRADRAADREDAKAARESRAKLYERVGTMAESLARLEGRLSQPPASSAPSGAQK